MATKRRSSSEEDEPAPKRKPSSEPKRTRPKNHWMHGLLQSMNDPAMIIKEDDTCTIIKDAYPKACHHYLVLPKVQINNLRVLDSTHVGLLKHMARLRQELIDDIKKKNPNVGTFRMGYHALPSMSRLHMHVISQDFDSLYLKNKKHWNSFTSEFFLDAKDVTKELEENGKLTINKEKYEQMLKLPLTCHVCDKVFSNMPRLKSHIILHQ